MELKVCVGTQRMPSRSRFQSHLYGIERASLYHHAGSTTRFNRTFMELKDLPSTDSSLALLFQSHLYGIESHIYSASDCRCYCFNRTFMELKAWNVVVDDAVEQFQSHLYGIERKDRILLKWCSGSVSIAPLWN